MPKDKRLRVYIYIVLVLLSFSSCYERQEGCLDITAKNYDFGADDPCEDCCTYPSLKFSVTHEWGDTFLMEDQLYFNDLGQYIKILSSEFYVSNVELEKDGEISKVEEMLDIIDLDGNISSISNSFAFIQSTRVTKDVGTFKHPDTYDKLTFTVGISGNFVALDSTQTFVEDDRFLNKEELEHTNFRLEYVVDTMSMDTLILELKGPSTSEQISLREAFEVPLGEDYSLPIIARYDLLLKDLNFLNLSNESEKEKLRSNFKDIFYF